MKKYTRIVSALVAAALLPLIAAAPASATLLNGNVVLSDPRPSATNVTYTFNATAGATTTANAVKCVVVELDTNASGTGGIPAGVGGLAGSTLSGTFNTGGTALSAFTRDASQAAAGIVSFTDATGGTGSNGTIVLSGVTNGSTPDDDFFVRINTFNNTNCATSPQDTFTSASIWTNGTTATITIEPSLNYTINAIGAAQACGGATTTDAATSTAFDLHPTLVTNKIAGQRHDVATNAVAGYSLYMRHSGLPTSGSNDIDALAGGASYSAPATFSAAGTEAWGFTTGDSTLAGGTANRFTNGGPKWAPLSTSVPGDVVADSAGPIAGAGGQTPLCFEAGASATTASGVYTTSVIYTAAGNF